MSCTSSRAPILISKPWPFKHSTASLQFLHCKHLPALRCADYQARSQHTRCLHKLAGYTETGAARIHCVTAWQKGISHPLKRNHSVEVPKTFNSSEVPEDWGVYPLSSLLFLVWIWFSALLDLIPAGSLSADRLWCLSPGLPRGAFYAMGLNSRGYPYYGPTALKAWIPRGKSVHFEGQNVVECRGARRNIFYDTQALQ